MHKGCGYECPTCGKYFCSTRCADLREQEGRFLDTCSLCRLHDFSDKDLLENLLEILGMSRETAVNLARGHALNKKG